MTESRIEWTDVTWNPTTGCTKISSGCRHCYAKTMSKRLKAMGIKKYDAGFNIALHENELDAPFRWKKPRYVFVNSMSDLFHHDVPDHFIFRVFDVMVRCPSHQFQVLTKRAGRLKEVAERLSWPSNVWMGVSVENSRQICRIDSLKATGAAVKFLSLEPLIGPLRGLDLTGINWVIVGGESGPNARPMDVSWVLDIRDTCYESRVPFFFKQWGGRNKRASGRMLAGRTYDEMPETRSAL